MKCDTCKYVTKKELPSGTEFDYCKAWEKMLYFGIDEGCVVRNYKEEEQQANTYKVTVCKSKNGQSCPSFMCSEKQLEENKEYFIAETIVENNDFMLVKMTLKEEWVK